MKQENERLQNLVIQLQEQLETKLTSPAAQESPKAPEAAKAKQAPKKKKNNKK